MVASKLAGAQRLLTTGKKYWPLPILTRTPTGPNSVSSANRPQASFSSLSVSSVTGIVARYSTTNSPWAGTW